MYVPSLSYQSKPRMTTTTTTTTTRHRSIFVAIALPRALLIIILGVGVAEPLDLQSTGSCHTTNSLLSSQRSLNIDIDAIADYNDGGSDCIMQASKRTYEQDGEEAREIAKHLPYYPFKGIPRFYDIGTCC